MAEKKLRSCDFCEKEISAGNKWFEIITHNKGDEEDGKRHDACSECAKRINMGYTGGF